jgi:hypothetical protein
MAKDNRIIKRAIRVTTQTEPGKPNTAVTYGPGQEDELAAALTQGQLDHYKSRGSIEGDWRSTATKAKSAPAE